MLSDAEQRRLFEIEALLRVNDPAFVRRFDTRWQTYQARRILAIVAFTIAVFTTMVALVAHGVVAAVIGLSVMGTAFGVWVSHRSR